MARPHKEHHLVERIGWLRAAVLGANDGIVSTASLIVGVASASRSHGEIMLAGIAGLVAGAMSMAAGEYVSVSSQADTERAEIAREKQELKDDPQFELRELAAIYEQRGLTPDLAQDVAHQLTEKDALAAHARDELGITAIAAARPIQAGVTSAITFSAGAAVPLIAAALAPLDQATITVSVAALLCLAALGVLGARTGGAPVFRAALRVTIWGTLALAVTAGIGRLVGAAI